MAQKSLFLLNLFSPSIKHFQSQNKTFWNFYFHTALSIALCGIHTEDRPRTVGKKSGKAVIYSLFLTTHSFEFTLYLLMTLACYLPLIYTLFLLALC